MKKFRTRRPLNKNLNANKITQTIIKKGYNNLDYREVHVSTDALKDFEVSIRDDAEALIMEVPLFRQFVRSSGQKLDFLKAIISNKQFFGKSGGSLSTTLYACGIQCSPMSISTYLKELMKLGIVVKVSDVWKIGAFTKTYKCNSKELHEIHVKVIHPQPDERLRRKITTMKRKLDQKPKRLEAWRELKAFCVKELKEGQLWKDGFKPRKAKPAPIVDFEGIWYSTTYLPQVMDRPDYKAEMNELYDKLEHYQIDHEEYNEREKEIALKYVNKYCDLSVKLPTFIDHKGFPMSSLNNLAKWDNGHGEMAAQSWARSMGKTIKIHNPKDFKAKMKTFYQILSKLVYSYRFDSHDFLKDMGKNAHYLGLFAQFYNYQITENPRLHGNQNFFRTIAYFFKRAHRKKTMQYPSAFDREKVKPLLLDIAVATGWMDDVYDVIKHYGESRKEAFESFVGKVNRMLKGLDLRVESHHACSIMQSYVQAC